MKKQDLASTLTFGFEQTFTTPNWWEDEGFSSTSDTPLKREKMLSLAKAIAEEINGNFVESVDVWGHIQFETFDAEEKPSFVVTMDPGSIEVKTQPALARDIKEMAIPLFAAADKVDLLPYRNWWYGKKGGTEGGCHVNMGGLSQQTNPLYADPSLVVKYAAYIHNRPWLHYPFMGIDIGPGGNAMRMDEKENFETIVRAFKEYKKVFSAEQTYYCFKDTNLVNEKASFPSFAKFKPGLFLIEDRAQEALRSPEELEYVAMLRLKILEHLQEQDEIEKLLTFKDIHKKCLSSYWLWEKFQYWANDLDINPVPYQTFFDRQFPTLLWGESAPNSFQLKEGRRPRVIKEIHKRGDVITSKTIDTRFKRLEMVTQTNRPVKLKGAGIEARSEVFEHKGYLGFGETEKSFYQYVDIKTDEKAPVLEFSIGNQKYYFDTLEMKWLSRKE